MKKAGRSVIKNTFDKKAQKESSAKKEKPAASSRKETPAQAKARCRPNRRDELDKVQRLRNKKLKYVTEKDFKSLIGKTTQLKATDYIVQYGIRQDSSKQVYLSSKFWKGFFEEFDFCTL